MVAISLAVLAGSLALVAVPAEAKIVPQRSIAGIELRMTRAEVIERKGEPDRERTIRHEIFGRQRVMRYGKTRVAFSGVRQRSEVILVRTRSRRQRTANGIGVGSRESAVEAGIPGVRCRTELGRRHCIKGRLRPGRRVTDFLISKRGRRVRAVTVAIVID